MLWLALVLFIALSVSVLRGGRLTNLADIRLRLWWLLPLGFVLQGAGGLVPDRYSWAEEAGVGLLLLSYLPLLALAILNKERPGMWLAGMGVLLNFTVIALNGGMPVLEGAVDVAAGFPPGGAAVDSFKHVVLDDGTLLPFLADVIPLRLVGSGSVISIGDVFLAVGLGRFLEAELRRPVRWFKHGASQGGSATRT